MDPVDFYPTEFLSIPKQDNPALGDDKCLMIVKATEDDKAQVWRVQPDNSFKVVKVALFWIHADAVDYCKMLEGKES